MYTAEQKAIAFEIVSRHDGSVTEDAMTEIRDILQLPELRRESVWRWINSLPVANRVAPKTQRVAQNATLKSIPIPNARHDPPSPIVMTQASRALDEMFEEVARKYLRHAAKDSVIEDTKGQAAVMAAAIATDKMRLLRGLPTEIVAILPELVAVMQERGLNPVLVFQSMRDKLQLPEKTPTP